MHTGQLVSAEWLDEAGAWRGLDHVVVGPGLPAVRLRSPPPYPNEEVTLTLSELDGGVVAVSGGQVIPLDGGIQDLDGQRLRLTLHAGAGDLDVLRSRRREDARRTLGMVAVPALALLALLSMPAPVPAPVVPKVEVERTVSTIHVPLVPVRPPIEVVVEHSPLPPRDLDNGPERGRSSNPTRKRPRGSKPVEPPPPAGGLGGFEGHRLESGVGVPEGRRHAQGGTQGGALSGTSGLGSGQVGGALDGGRHTLDGGSAGGGGLALIDRPAGDRHMTGRELDSFARVCRDFETGFLQTALLVDGSTGPRTLPAAEIVRACRDRAEKPPLARTWAELADLLDRSRT